jgi:hypothetical protein
VTAKLKADWGCFKELPHKLDNVRVAEDCMSITFKPGLKDHVPKAVCYKTPRNFLPKMKEILKELIEKGIIRPSTSPFCSPCMLVPKPHQEGCKPEDIKYRLVVNLKAINECTVTMHHRIPNINNIWSTLGKAKYFTVLDLVKEFMLRSGAQVGRQACKRRDKQATTACQAGGMAHANISLNTK